MHKKKFYLLIEQFTSLFDITYLESTFRCILRMIGVIQIGEKQQLVLYSHAVESGCGDSIYAWIEYFNDISYVQQI